MSANPIQQLSDVPVQTPVLANNGNFTLGWIQWLQAVRNILKAMAYVSTNTPANPSVVVAWQQVVQNGQTYYLPLYQ